MVILKKIRNYLCYCGIDKKEYDAIKRDVYVSNFVVWRILHCLLSAAFGFLFVYSLFDKMFGSNRWFYLAALLYSLFAMVSFWIIKKDSFVAQIVIHVSIFLLFLFGCLITQNKPELPATMFFVLLLIVPMFMINPPFIMGSILVVVSVVFSVWMYKVKPYVIWRYDFNNVMIYTVVGFFLHIIANSVRIKEFVLTRKINIQKDTDDLTGLKNKAALTREINEFLADKSRDEGVMLMIDINNFKVINDTYGHDVGDSVIKQFGAFLNAAFTDRDIVGRFGGDEFIVFIKDAVGAERVDELARRVIDGAAQNIVMPDENQKLAVCIGIAVYHGEEKNYSEIFKRADMALYEAKAERTAGYSVCQ